MGVGVGEGGHFTDRIAEKGGVGGGTQLTAVICKTLFKN